MLSLVGHEKRFITSGPDSLGVHAVRVGNAVARLICNSRNVENILNRSRPAKTQFSLRLRDVLSASPLPNEEALVTYKASSEDFSNAPLRRLICVFDGRTS